MSKVSIFGADDEADDEANISINKSYASKYEKWRHKEELQKLKARYGDDDEDDDSDDDEEEDENADKWDLQMERDWLKAYGALKAKDPVIYDKSATFYTESATDGSKAKAAETKTTPMRLKDYERKFILEKGGRLDDDDDDEDHVEMKLGYFKEQEALKQRFAIMMFNSSINFGISILQASTEIELDDEDALFKTRAKTTEETKQEEVI